MSEKSMNEKNERNLDSTVDEIMEEIRDQTVSEVKDINEKEQKSEERPRKKKVTKTKTEYLGNKKRQKKFTIQRVKRYQAKIDRLRKRLRAGKRK